MNWKKVLLIFIALLIFAATPSKVFAEKINSFADSININSDGTISVSEKIDYDFEGIYRHGIFRTIPTVKTNSAGKKFRLDLKNISVVDNQGNQYQFDKSYQDPQDLELKIGDPNQTITGLHTYIINYEVGGALTYFSGHDELYWNITGNNWQIPIEKSSASITLTKNLSSADTKLTCFTGPAGSNASDCSSSYAEGKASFQSNNFLNPSEGMTVVVGFPKNTVAVLEPKEIISFFDTPQGKMVAIVLTFLALLIGLFWYLFYPLKIAWKWYKIGRDPKVPLGVASSWYEPPTTQSLRKLTPGETGTLIDEKADMEDISATIIDLARRGYIKIIEKNKNDFYLEKIKDYKKDDSLQPFETEILDGIFDGEDNIRIKDADLLETVTRTKDLLYQSMVTDGFFEENPDKIRKFYTIMWILAMVTLNPLLFVSALFFGMNLPHKTIQGAQSANIAKSLKNFLVSQERQLNFQAKNQMFFEKLLPFAVAFGVEKIWADRFKDIAIKPPSWYQGYNTTNFSSFYLVNSLNSSFHSISKAATPTSSSSGFSSGFSGGSSGGGGGGGGGGSW